MENRSFDHYFGVDERRARLRRSLSDSGARRRPSCKRKTVWYQRNDSAPAGTPRVLAPQHIDTTQRFRAAAQLEHAASLSERARSLGPRPHGPLAAVQDRPPRWSISAQADLPFQFALADAFTLCDANHCSMTGGTNPNRCYFFTGTNHGNDAPRRRHLQRAGGRQRLQHARRRRGAGRLHLDQLRRAARRRRRLVADLPERGARLLRDELAARLSQLSRRQRGERSFGLALAHAAPGGALRERHPHARPRPAEGRRPRRPLAAGVVDLPDRVGLASIPRRRARPKAPPTSPACWTR